MDTAIVNISKTVLSLGILYSSSIFCNKIVNPPNHRLGAKNEIVKYFNLKHFFIIRYLYIKFLFVFSNKDLD